MTEHYTILAPIAENLPYHECYLEIGCSDGATFSRVAPLFKQAIGVDIRTDLAPHIEPYGEYFGGLTSDDFFFRAGPTLPPLDFVWIDGCHDHDFSFRDFQNALKAIKPLTGLICLHDTYPPSEYYVSGGCSDSYRTAIAIRSIPDVEVVTLPGGFGITIARYVPQGKHLAWMP